MLLLSVGNVQLKEYNNSQLHRKYCNEQNTENFKRTKKIRHFTDITQQKPPKNLITPNIAKDRICALINAMWVAMSPLREMAAPHTSQMCLKWSFFNMLLFVIFSYKIPMESHGVP